MGRIVFSIVSLVVLTIIIVMNVGTISSFNLLGRRFEEVPIVVIAIVSFVAGAVYSFIYYISSYFARSRKEKLAMQKQRLKSQEKQMKDKDATLKAREKQVEQITSGVPSQRALPPGTGRAGNAGAEPFAGERHVGGGSSVGGARRSGSTAGRKKRGWLGSLFGRNSASGR
ncbi:MAG: hypothetical protein ACLFUA_10710 [Spirochaetales bacterium]